MKEQLEFRIVTEGLAQCMPDLVGEDLGIVTRVFLDAGDPRIDEIVRLQREWRVERDEPFHYHWCYHRKYEPHELAAAELLQLEVRARVESCGEEFKTEFDDRERCERCGLGRRQLSALRFAPSKLNRKHDIIETLSNELIVSDRFALALTAAGCTGFRLARIERSQPPHTTLDGWQQLCIEGGAVEIIPPTRFGIDLSDADEEGTYRCADCAHVGLNQLSRAHIARASWNGSDLCASRQRVGTLIGHLNPRPILMFSQRARTSLTAAKLKNFRLEPVTLI